MHWHALRLKGIQVPQRVVEELRRELDPVGFHERKAYRLQWRQYMNPGPPNGPSALLTFCQEAF